MDTTAPETNVRTYRGQLYCRVGTRQRERHDGRMMEMIIWRANCAQCGAVFKCSTPSGGKFNPSRRCKAHRMPGIKVGKSNIAHVQNEGEGQ